MTRRRMRMAFVGLAACLGALASVGDVRAELPGDPQICPDLDFMICYFQCPNAIQAGCTDRPHPTIENATCHAALYCSTTENCGWPTEPEYRHWCRYTIHDPS